MTWLISAEYSDESLDGAAKVSELDPALSVTLTGVSCRGPLELPPVG